MGVTAGILGAVAAGGSVLETRKARKEAEAEAARQREALAEIQAEEPPELPTKASERRGRRRSIRDLLSRRGRRSTILSNQESGDSLGA